MIVDSNTETDHLGNTLAQWDLYDDGTVVLKDGQGQVVTTVPPTADTLALAQRIGTTRVVETNRTKIEARAVTAIADNVTWLGKHATRQAAIDQMVADATAGKTASVTTVAQAQTAVRQLSDLCLRLSNALDQTEVLLQSTVKQLTAVERLILSRLDSTVGT